MSYPPPGNPPPPPPGQWQGHGPWCPCYRCRKMAGQAGHREPWRIVVAIVAVLVIAWAVLKIGDNEATRNSPPAACQLLGGHWNIWDGWQCD
jgi:hypothetical protein